MKRLKEPIPEYILGKVAVAVRVLMASVNINPNQPRPGSAVVGIDPLRFAPCGLRGCKNGPAAFPGRMSYKATKPGLVSVLYLSMFLLCCCLLGPLFIYC